MDKETKGRRGKRYYAGHRGDDGALRCRGKGTRGASREEAEVFLFFFVQSVVHLGSVRFA